MLKRYIHDYSVIRRTVINAVSSDADVQGVRRFNELLASEPRVSSTTATSDRSP
ncbi:MAG: hypothetical protein PUP90_01700 [Nostoc sp. S4]|nr:hypothetical protein [Nostoc sp. S4]